MQKVPQKCSARHTAHILFLVLAAVLVACGGSREDSVQPLTRGCTFYVPYGLDPGAPVAPFEVNSDGVLLDGGALPVGWTYAADDDAGACACSVVEPDGSAIVGVCGEVRT